MESRMTISENGTEEWYNERGVYHRDDGPAVIYLYGAVAWYKDGFFHRINGPAITRPSGSEMWYQNGKLHREDGPAIICSSGLKEWFLNGKELSFTEWANEINLDQKTRLEMVMKWNPK